MPNVDYEVTKGPGKVVQEFQGMLEQWWSCWRQYRLFGHWVMISVMDSIPWVCCASNNVYCMRREGFFVHLTEIFVYLMYFFICRVLLNILQYFYSDSLWLIVKHTMITILILFTLILRGTPVSMTSAVSDAPLTYDDGIQINSRSINAIEPSNILRKFCRAW